MRGGINSPLDQLLLDWVAGLGVALASGRMSVNANVPAITADAAPTSAAARKCVFRANVTTDSD